jgi:hypothetical protein
MGGRGHSPELALLTGTANLAALQPSNGFLFLDSAQFTLGNKPALAANGAQYAALNDLFAESFQELILRFIGAQDY